MTGRRTAGTMIRIMETKRNAWDFALKLEGASPAALPMSKLAEYIALWAQAIGSDARPIFKGVVKGSAVIRAAVDNSDKATVAKRISNAANDSDFDKCVQQLESMLRRDGFRSAQVLTADNHVLRMVLPEQKPTPEVTIHDTAEIDGVVFRISGKDNTTSVGLLEEGTGRSITVETTNDALARRFAINFKGAVLRVRTRGTWTRNSEGVWEPKKLIAESFEELDDTPLHETMAALRQIKTDWASMPDPIAEWKRIRGIE